MFVPTSTVLFRVLVNARISMLSTSISQPDVALERCPPRRAQPQGSPHTCSYLTSAESRVNHLSKHWAPKVARAVWNTGSPFVLFCLEQHVVPLHQTLISAAGTPQGMGWDIGCPWAAPQGFSSVLVPACCLRGSRRCLWWHPVHISVSLFLGQIIVTTHSLLT